MGKIDEFVRIRDEVSISGLSPVEQRKALSAYLDGEIKKEDGARVSKTVKDEIQAPFDLDHFESTTPW